MEDDENKEEKEVKLYVIIMKWTVGHEHRKITTNGVLPFESPEAAHRFAAYNEILLNLGVSGPWYTDRYTQYEEKFNSGGTDVPNNEDRNRYMNIARRESSMFCVLCNAMEFKEVFHDCTTYTVTIAEKVRDEKAKT